MSAIQVYLFPLPVSETAKPFYSSLDIQILKTTKLFFVERIKTARQFIASLKLSIEIDSLEFVEIDQKNSLEFQIQVSALLNKEKRAIIMSESGCPGVADPGSQIVSLAHRLGATVTPLIGPSSILLALMGSGFNGQQFTFHGYLPIDKVSRLKTLQKLEYESIKHHITQIFIEAPHRNQAIIETMLIGLKPETRLCIAMDLTGEKELLKTMTISQWKKNNLSIEKLPTIFLLGR